MHTKAVDSPEVINQGVILLARTLVETTQKIMIDHPNEVQRLAQQVYEPHAKCMDVAGVLADSLARQGDYAAASEFFQEMVSAEDGFELTAVNTRCPACGDSEHEVCWVGMVEGQIRTWVRCEQCRTARDLHVRCQDRVEAARRQRLSNIQMSETMLQQHLVAGDRLIEKIREEGYGSHWLNRPGGPKALMLEIGSGWGGFLSAAAWRGFEAQGVESTHDSAQWARDRLGVLVCSDLESLPESACDVVVIRDGFTGVRSPGQLLSRIVNRMVPEGLLAISVPVRDSPVHRAMGYDDPIWTSFEHITLFDQSGLSLLLLRSGLQPIKAWHNEMRPGEIIVLSRNS